MFWTRLASGVVLLAIALLSMSLGNITLTAVLCVISLIAYRELTKMLRCSGEGKKLNDLETAGLIGVLTYYAAAFQVGVMGEQMALLPAVMIGVFLLEMLIYVVTFPKYHIHQVMGNFFSFCYAPVMLAFILLTRELGSMGFYVVWLILISSWGSDTCAYAVGVLIGKHKIFPVLSPKKSLEGCIGGIAGAALLGGLYGHFFVDAAFPGQPIALLLALICGVGAVISMVGDLAASAIKRNFDTKDYGKLIPGHGGIMDRFDSVIVTAPIVYYLALFLLQ